MSETILNFRCDVTMHEQAEGDRIAAAGHQPDATSRCPKFSMLAYTGAVAHVRGFEHPIIVDLSGVQVNSQRIPIRRDHKEWAAVGHSTKIDISGGIISARGIISRDTEYSRDIIHSGKLGFPWQASIGGPVHKTQFLTAQKKGKVNGMEVEGPLHIVQKMTLKEISFVEYGADPNTSASVEAITITGENTRELFLTGGLNLQQQNQSEVSMENQNMEKPVTATNVEPKTETSINTTALPGALAEAKAKPPAQSIGLEQAEAEVLAYRKKLIQERERINRIEQLAKGRFHDLKMKAIAEGWEPDQFELETLRTDRETPTEVIRKSVSWESDNQVLEVIALTASGLAHSAFADKYDPMVLEKTDKEFWRELLIKKATENKQDELVRHLSNDKVWNAAWGHLVVMDQVGMTIRKDEGTLKSAAKEAGVTILVIAQIAYLLFRVWLALRQEKRNKKGASANDDND